MNSLVKPAVRFIRVDPQYAGQRVDNYLLAELKGAPKSLIYRWLRKGEVRVNKKRIKPTYRLVGGDLLRIPPVRLGDSDNSASAPGYWVELVRQSILFEDEQLIAVAKPTGLAVHGGSGLSYGLIECVRQLRDKSVELVHRLDRDTSGVILLAKKRPALRALHQMFRDGAIDKTYWALVHGQWPDYRDSVTSPLKKNTLVSGERIVRVDPQGQAAETRFACLERFAKASLMRVSPLTGRTHQIRVHCQAAGHPIVGDEKYGVGEKDRALCPHQTIRLCLHAKSLAFVHPLSGKVLAIEAPLDAAMQTLLEGLHQD